VRDPRKWADRLRPQRLPVGSVAEPLANRERDARLRQLGQSGARGRALHKAALRRIAALRTLTPVSTSVALRYAERVARPLAALDEVAATEIVLLGYAAHQLVEEQPDAYGVDDIPVLGALPKAPPRDLANRVLRASRKDFAVLCALSPETWESFSACSLATAQRRPDRPEGPGHVSADVVDGLLRFGWILRQADLYYGLNPPDRSADPEAGTGNAGAAPAEPSV
jgi:hypothetical protein